MANPIGARQDGGFKAVCTAPSINKTPVGNATPPLPYPTTADLSNSIGTVSNVRFNGKPAYVLDQSVQPSCKGDDAGTAKGIRSGTVNGAVEPSSASGSVSAGKKRVVREGDACTMNGGNNPGIYITTQTRHAIIPRPSPGQAHTSAQPETAEEQGFWSATQAFLGDIAKGYREHAVEEVEAALGADAPQTYKRDAGLGENLGRILSQAATDVMENAREGAGPGRPRMPSTAIRPGKRQPASNRDTPPPGGPSGTGVSIVGPDGKGDCGIKPYKDQKCPKGQHAHHIVPDYALRYGNRKDSESRIPGMPSLKDGPSICLSGSSPASESDHGKAHRGTDPRIDAAGRRTDNGPPGTALIGEILDISVEEVSKLRPHCGEQIRNKVDEAFKDVDRQQYGRTTQPLPKGDTRAVLEQGKTHSRGKHKR
jgi:hypothetical protein